MMRSIVIVSLLGPATWAMCCGNGGSGAGDGGTDTGPDPELTWIALPGGAYEMGSADEDTPAADLPRHEVSIQPFEMSREEVTVAQYRLCVEAGACAEPKQADGYPVAGKPLPPQGGGQGFPWSSYDAWGEGRDEHPVSAVTWGQAVAYCDWAGGRLPSEAEWEYAARSGGKEKRYPWGDGEEPGCDLAIVWESAGACGEKTTWPVCSKPAGSTEQGLCDMAGSVREWVMDCYHFGYEGAPADGSAWTEECAKGWEERRITRGGAFDDRVYPLYGYAENYKLETTDRDDFPGNQWWVTIGFRCVR